MFGINTEISFRSCIDIFTLFLKAFKKEQVAKRLKLIYILDHPIRTMLFISMKRF